MGELQYKVAISLLFLVMAAIRFYYAGIVGWARASAKGTGVGESAFRITGTAAALLLAVYLLSSWLDAFRIPLTPWLRWAGGSVFLLGDLLFWWSHAALGRNWSPVPEILPGQTLVMSGPYRYVRHPMYSSWFLICIGISLLTANWPIAVAFIGSAVTLYAARIRSEEQMLIARFGEEYRKYSRRTGRILPKIRV